MGNSWGLSLLATLGLAASAVASCVGDSGSTADAAKQGSLGGACYPDNGCNAGLTCVLVNGSALCELSDAASDGALQDVASGDGPIGDVATEASSCDACGGQTPVCDQTLQQCVQCLNDLDCSGKHCSSSHTCVQCNVSTDCGGATPYCNPNSNTCVQCLVSSNCTSPQQCVNNTCVNGE